MDILDRFFNAARQRRRTVVLPEGEDPRVVTAARRLKDESLAEPILLGSPVNLSRRPAGGRRVRRHSPVDPQTVGQVRGVRAAYIASS